MDVPAHGWTAVRWRHPSTQLEPASTAPLCFLSEDGLCSVIVDTWGTVTCWQTGKKNYSGWFIAVCFCPEGTKACPTPKHCRIKTKTVSCIPKTGMCFTLRALVLPRLTWKVTPQELHTPLRAERRQSGAERVRMDLPKHFPLEEIRSLLVFCARARLLTTELKINYWLVKSETSVTQCDLLQANRIKSKLLISKPEGLKRRVFKVENSSALS